MQIEKKRRVHWGIFLFAIFGPLITRLIQPDFYHLFDVNTFKEWGAFTQPWRNIYLTSCYCNYPIIGLFVSTGLIELLGNSITNYLITISLVDGINVILIYYILRQLHFQNPLIWAGIIGLIPSTWVGGFLWGQIDNVGQLILCACLICLIQLTRDKSAKRWYLHVAFGVCMLVGLLTKQLLVFSLFGIGIGYLIWLFKKPSIRESLINFTMACSGFLVPLFMIEIWLYIPEQYTFFHLEKILDTGSEHMEIISGNGFNVWTFFYSDQNTSSSLPLLGTFSPLQIGLFLFFVYFISITIRLFQIPIFTLSSILIYIALINLGMNVFFTGTHERYLYHCYPFLISGILIASKEGKQLKNKYYTWLLYFTIAAAICYGVFVFGVLMKNWKEGYFYKHLFAHRITAVIHIMVLAANTIFFYLNYDSKRTDQIDPSATD